MTHAEMIDPRRASCLGELLEEACITFKTETALIEVRRKVEAHRLSYLEVRRAAAPLIRFLESRGIGAGSRVAILMSNQSRWLLTAYAIFHRGGVLVPLDYKLAADEQDALLEHSGAELLVTEHGLLKRFGDGGPSVAHVLSSEAPESAPTRADVTRFEDLEPPGGETPKRVDRQREDLATVVYSSGTGGRAKGCMLTHDAYLEQLRSLMGRFPMRPGHRAFSVLPTNHAIDFMVGFVGPFSCGATVIHQRTLRREFLQSTMRAYGVTHMALVPMLLSAFEDSIREQTSQRPRWAQRAVSLLGGLNEMLTIDRPRPEVSRALLSPIHEAFGGDLELLFCGGAFVDRERAEYFYRLGLPVVIGYGLTEACTVATVNDLAPFRADTVGRALEGTEVSIHAPGADGVGEVWIRGRTLMSGYLDDEELTRQAITEDGWLRTGDLGWLDAAHHLHLVGRQKNMIVTEGGKNVYPEDIEGAFEELPVEELAVFASGYLWPRAVGLTEERLVAIVRKKAGNGIEPSSSDAIVAALGVKNRRLPDFKRVKSVLFWDDAFPRTASMKIKRLALAEALREGASREALLAVEAR